MHIHLSINPYTYPSINQSIHVRTFEHTYACTHCKHTSTRARTCAPLCTHTHRHTDTHTQTHRHRHRHRHTHRHTHTLHKHIHTHTWGRGGSKRRDHLCSAASDDSSGIPQILEQGSALIQVLSEITAGMDFENGY